MRHQSLSIQRQSNNRTRLSTLPILLLAAHCAGCSVKTNPFNQQSSPLKLLGLPSQVRSLSSTSQEKSQNNLIMENDGGNVMVMTAHEMQKQMVAGRVTSQQLVSQHLDQIFRYNRDLNLLIEVSPSTALLHSAWMLDKERRDGRVRSALHGIPIIVKVSTPIA